MTKDEMRSTLKTIKEFRDGALTYKQLLEGAPLFSSAKEFAVLLDLIEHQPANEGLFSNSRMHDDYEKEINEEITRLSEYCDSSN